MLNAKLTGNCQYFNSLRKLLKILAFFTLINVFLFKNHFNDYLNNSMLNRLSPILLTSKHVQSPKIFCIIFTYEKNFNTSAKATYETWAKKCDNYKFISKLPSHLLTSSSLNQTKMSIEIKYNNLYTILQPAGLSNDTYNELSQKVFITFKDIYKRYKGYDWYLKADDDTFIIVDNLRQFLKRKNPNQPVTYGYDFKLHVPYGYHSGGAGYVLSKEAFNRLGAKLNSNFKFCKNDLYEDVDVAKCLRKLNVYPNISVDDLGRERFHCLSLDGHYFGRFPSWLNKYALNKPQKGVNCCSDESISFHYMNTDSIYKLNLALKEQQKNEILNDTTMTRSFKFILKKYFNLNNGTQ